MNKNIVIVGIITLIIGIGIGYMVRPSGNAVTTQTASHSTSPSGMEQTLTGMTESLKGKTGEALEIAFLEGMIAHHEGAVAMATELKGGTKRPELLKLADDIISAQTNEIGMMKGWLNQWFER